MFDRIYFINLRRRPDRLAAFRALQAEHGWALPSPIIFDAIEGDKVGVMAGFTQGGGAWGCLRSHVSILEKCVMEDVPSVLVLEDDVTWFSGAWQNLDKFMASVPSDWDQLMLGGQHIGASSRPFSEGVVRAYNCQRTHAYAIRGPAMRSLLNLWYKTTVHIDWVMGNWQGGFKVYAPDPFIFGQSGGKSDISGRTNAAQFWTPPKDIPVIHLVCPVEVVKRLRGHGFHTGYDRDADDLDRGLVRVAKLEKRDVGLKKFLDTILWECASDEGTVAVVYHPDITFAEVQRVEPAAISVSGTTVEECLKQVSHLKLKVNYGASHCLILRGPREVAEGLVGFHRGFWRDAVTGQDNGLRAVAVLADKTEGLRKWFTDVGKEAEKMAAVPLVWHSGISLADVSAATDRKIVEVEAATVDEALIKWKEKR